MSSLLDQIERGWAHLNGEAFICWEGPAGPVTSCCLYVALEVLGHTIYSADTPAPWSPEILLGVDSYVPHAPQYVDISFVKHYEERV